jgi:hypothetical protein
MTFLALGTTAKANTFTFFTPAGSTSGGEAVSASATFTTSADTVDITLQNLIVNQKSISQNISDLFFSVSTGATSGSITTSAGTELTVAGDGTSSDGGSVATGWVLSNTAGVFHLDVLSAPVGPAHTILGEPDAGGVYSNANASIAGNVPHNPFLAGPVTFSLNVAGVTSDTSVSGAVLSFGTAPGSNVPIPEPAFYQMMAFLGLGGIGLVRHCRKARKSA